MARGKSSGGSAWDLFQRLSREGRKLREDQRPHGKSNYGRGSASENYGSSSFSMKSGTFDGFPSLSRHREDGAIDIFYGPGQVDLDDPNHGHAVIRNGKLVYKRRPGEATPVIDRDN